MTGKGHEKAVGQGPHPIYLLELGEVFRRDQMVHYYGGF